MQSMSAVYESVQNTAEWLDDTVYEPYLEEIQRRTIKVLVAWIISGVILFGTQIRWGFMKVTLPKIGKISFNSPYLYPSIKNSISTNVFHAARASILPSNVEIFMTGPFDALKANLYTVALLATMISMPVIVYEVFMYFRDALYSDEKRLIAMYSVPISVLFSVGIVFGYFVFLPFALPYLMGWAPSMGAEKMITIDRFASFVMYSLVGLGLLFEMPVLQYGLTRIGFVEAKDWRHGFGYAAVGLSVVAAFITPGDIPSTLMVFLPALGLYGLGYLVSKYLGGR